MSDKITLTAPNGSDFRGAQAAAAQQPHAEQLDLFAEELPEQHDTLKGECVACAFTAGSAGGTVSSFSTWGSFS